jgi:hypothetical protein
VYAVGILTILYVIISFLWLIDDSRPTVRQFCRAHPTWNEAIFTNGDDEIVRTCHHSGLAEMTVTVLSPIEYWSNAAIITVVADLESGATALIATVLSPLESWTGR